MDINLVDSTESVVTLLERIEGAKTRQRSLFLDLEGKNLSRHGTVAILQVFIPPSHVYIVDVHVLQHKAFQTPSSTGLTFKSVLEDASISKVFFDVRHDSDALYAHFDVKLAGVQDVQLLEFATRRVPGRFLQGLSKCIEKDAQLSGIKQREWDKVKKAGLKLFRPEEGGSYEVFQKRPLNNDILKYCVQDVTLLPDLLRIYSAKLTPSMASRVQAETTNRIRQSQATMYIGDGPHMAKGPWAPYTQQEISLGFATASPLTLERSIPVSPPSRISGLTGAAPESLVSKPGVAIPASTISSKVESTQKSLEKPEAVNPPANSLGPIAAALGALRLSDADRHEVETEDFDRGKSQLSDVDAHEDETEDFDFWESQLSDDNSPADYTACSSEDCGYCGHCDY